MKLVNRVAALAAVCLLTACASTGVKVADNQVAALRPGITTEADVVNQFGQPTSRTRMADGSVMIQYVYAKAKFKASTFIPIVGVFTGGMDTHSNAVMLIFGPDGKLKNTSGSTSNMETNTGLTAH